MFFSHLGFRPLVHHTFQCPQQSFRTHRGKLLGHHLVMLGSWARRKQEQENNFGVTAPLHLFSSGNPQVFPDRCDLLPSTSAAECQFGSGVFPEFPRPRLQQAQQEQAAEQAIVQLILTDTVARTFLYSTNAFPGLCSTTLSSTGRVRRLFPPFRRNRQQ